MKLNIPTTYTAGRRITLDGTTYQPGASIPPATVKGLRRLSSLLSNRWIIPNVDLHRRRARARTPRPNDASPLIRKSL